MLIPGRSEEDKIKRVAILIVTGFLLGAIPVSSCVQGIELGAGVSSEPVDISGGGFFLDIIGDAPLWSPFSLHTTFSVGPLPVEPSFFFLDGTFVMGFPLEEFRLYAGAGAGLGHHEDKGLFLMRNMVVGVKMALAENFQLFAQAKLRSFRICYSTLFGRTCIKSFVAPGWGIEFSF